MNVDIDDTGMVSRRDGTTLINSASSHSLWSDGDKDCLFVSEGNLYRLNTDNSASLLKSGVTDSRMSYCKVGSIVYCTNSVMILSVVDDVVSDVTTPDRINKHTMPAGQLVEYHMNRLYVAKDNVVWYSDAVFHTRTDLRKNFKQFNSEIQMLRAVTGGIYVSDENKTYFMAGEDPDKMRLVEVFDYPATFGTDVRIDGEEFRSGEVLGKLAIWSAPEGICIGFPNGQAINVTAGKYNMPTGTKGAGAFRETSRDVSQYLTVLQS